MALEGVPFDGVTLRGVTAVSVVCVEYCNSDFALCTSVKMCLYTCGSGSWDNMGVSECEADRDMCVATV
jgi:hypothetical protein